MFQYTAYTDNKSIMDIIQRSCNHVDSRLMDHGFRVSYIVSQILESIEGYHDKEKRDICLLAMLHDVGAYKTEEISKMVQFETNNIWEHSVYGYLFLKYFSPLKHLADIVLFHHTSWNSLKDRENISDEVKRLAQIINIADRIDIFMESVGCNQVECHRKLEEGRDTRFASDILDIVQNGTILASAVDIARPTPTYHHLPAYQRTLWDFPFTQQEVDDYLKMIIFIIDFRSRHTVTHTITTTSISHQLALRSGLSDEYVNQIVCGALLHDLGKIGIPVEILEFPGKLSAEAMNIMRTHVDITEQILGGVIEESIGRIALRHHEKLDGSGYPKGLCTEELTTGERIVAVADIVSALAGTRSYKDSYSKDRIVRILEQLRDDNLLDSDIVNLVIWNFDEIMEVTNVRCQPVLDIYHTIQTTYTHMVKSFSC